MIHPGEIMVNPVLGHKITFVTTSQNARTDEFVFDLIIPPNSSTLYQDHFHLEQEQRVEIISGQGRYRLDGIEHEASQGDLVVFPVGHPHIDPWNIGSHDLQVRITFSPGRTAEASFEIVRYLIDSGQLPLSGNFTLVQNAMIIHTSGFQTFMAGVPVPIQRALLAVLATLGPILGYKANERSNPMLPRMLLALVALLLVFVSVRKLLRGAVHRTGA